MFDRVSKFLREVRAELGKVTWPTRQELIGSTGVVIFFSLAFAAFLGIFDLFFLLFSKAVNLMMN